MSDYSTSTTPDETQYQENTPTITPEIVDAGSELKTPDVGDENNPIVLLSEKLPETEKHQLSDDECAFTREEAEALTQDLQLKYRDTIEAHYNLIAGVRKAHDGHIWLALGYPQGAAGWKAYCKDYFKASAVKLTREQRDNLILGLVEPNADGTGDITNADIAILLGVDRTTVGRVRAKAGIAQAGKVRDARGRMHTIDSAGMSSKERQQEIVRLREEGMKQTEIAEQLDVSQSTVSDALRRDKEQRMSDGLAEVAPMAPAEVEDVPDDQTIDLDEGNAVNDEREWVDAVCSYIERADEYLGDLLDEMQGDKWRPGEGPVDEIVVRKSGQLMDLIDKVGKLVRIIDNDSDDLWPGDNEYWDRFNDETLPGLESVVKDAQYGSDDDSED